MYVYYILVLSKRITNFKFLCDPEYQKLLLLINIDITQVSLIPEPVPIPYLIQNLPSLSFLSRLFTLDL